MIAKGAAADRAGQAAAVAEELDAPTPGGLSASLAVPLLHQERLVGTLAVVTSGSAHVFTHEDAELLEMLASAGAAALVALKRGASTVPSWRRAPPSTS